MRSMTSTHRSTAHGRRQAGVDGTKGIWNCAEDDLLVDVKAAGGAVAGSCANIGRRTCGRAVSKAPRVPAVSFGVRNDPERSTHLMGDWANGADTPTSSEAVAGRLALCGRGVGRIIDQPIIDLTVLCLHPLASTLIRKGWKEPRTLVEEPLHYSLRGRCYAEETLRLCLGWIVQCMKHSEEQILSILHRTMLRDAQIARARLVYWKSPRTLAFFHLSRNLVHSRKD